MKWRTEMIILGKSILRQAGEVFLRRWHFCWARTVRWRCYSCKVRVSVPGRGNSMCKGTEAGKGVVCSWSLKMTVSEHKWVQGKASLMGGWGERPESDDAAFVLNAVGSFWGYSAWKLDNPIYLLRSGLSSLICKMWVNKRLHREMQIKTTMRLPLCTSQKGHH